MPKTRRIQYTRRADGDILDIGAYTSERWGESRQDEYLAQLKEGFDLLSMTPLLGRARDELQPGLRSFPIGGHLVFYLVTDDTIVVVRVLHARRDVTHLDWPDS